MMRQWKVDAYARLIRTLIFWLVIGYLVIGYADTGELRYAVVGIFWLLLGFVVWLIEAE